MPLGGRRWPEWGEKKTIRCQSRRNTQRRVVVIIAPQAAEDQRLRQLAAVRVARDPDVARRRDPPGEGVPVVRDRPRIGEVGPGTRAELTLRHGRSIPNVRDTPPPAPKRRAGGGS